MNEKCSSSSPTWNISHGGSEYEYKEVYTHQQLTRIHSEFDRIGQMCYLDHAGSTLYSKSHIEAYTSTLLKGVFGNPHSKNPSSTSSTDGIDSIRLRILHHFRTCGDEYAVILTSGATSALKIIAQSFTFQGGPFAYMEECHTSVIGMREVVEDVTDGIHAIPFDAMVDSLGGSRDVISTNQEIPPPSTIIPDQLNGLVAFPAQCNFSGYKYPLNWIQKIQTGGLKNVIGSKKFSIHQSDRSKKTHGTEVPCEVNRWFVLLDAAAFVSTNQLDLSIYPADFVCLSFYKMFGFPTGLGALLVRKSSASLLTKKYIGGGTVEVLIPSSPFHVNKKEIHGRFEDGTVDFLSILSLHSGFDTWMDIGISLDKISLKAFRLVQYAYSILSSMKYENGQPVAQIYTLTSYDSLETAGPILTFNLLQSNGKFIGYSQVEEIAFVHGIHLRYGCFCNPGACRRFLGYEPSDLLRHFEAGHVCGDMKDLIDGKPTGAIRLSVGYMTTKAQVDQFLSFIYGTWVLPFSLQCITDPIPKFKNSSLINPEMSPKSQNSLCRILIYPIKSCSPFILKGIGERWEIGSRGLMYDREWLITNSLGVPLTQKREPRLCLIQPIIDISNRRLRLTAHGYPEVKLPLDYEEHQKTLIEICYSKVCGKQIEGINCGSEISDWLSSVLDSSHLKLIRLFPPSHLTTTGGTNLQNGGGRNSHRSLANDSAYVLVTLSSLERLALHLRDSKGITFTSQNDDSEEVDLDPNQHGLEQTISNLMRRFRPNLVVSSIEPSYEEENWNQIQIGPLTFKSEGPCSRCGTICVDPITGQRSSEPLLSLTSSRLQQIGNPRFGIHLGSNHSSSSSLCVGDPLRIVSRIIPETSRLREYQPTNKSQKSTIFLNQNLIESID